MEDKRQELYEDICRLQMMELESTEFTQELYIVLDKYEIQGRTTEIAMLKEDRNTELLKRFIIAKTVSGRTDRTVKYYKTTITNVLNAIGKTIDDITSDDVRLYIAKRIRIDKVSKVTANNELRAFKTFFGWMHLEGLIKENPVLKIEQIKCQKQKKKALTEIEIERIRNALRGEREKAIFEILLSTGCRVAELVNIRLDEVKDDEVLVHGKGQKDRIVYLNAKALIAIENYMKLRKDNSPWLFPGGVSKLATIKGSEQWNWWQHPELVLNEHVDIATIESMMRKIAKRAGIESCNPHKIRRTCATLALKKGMPLILVSKMLGHEQLDTTKIYLDVSEDDLMQAHKRYVNQ